MTVLVWILSVTGACLFAAAGFFLARLYRQETPPPPAILSTKGASSADVARLRLELEASELQRHESERVRARAVQPLQAKIQELEGAVQGHTSQSREWRRHEDELVATLESLSQERDSAYARVQELEKTIAEFDNEPTNLDVSPAQVELLKDQLRKAEARGRVTAAELATLQGQIERADARVGNERKPSTLVGMVPPDEGEMMTVEGDVPATQDFPRPKTLVGVQDPEKLYLEAQAEVARVRAELEKTRVEVNFWKARGEKLTSEASDRSSRSRAQARERRD